MEGKLSQRGILSEADREYLMGKSDIEPKTQAERNARARIRNRVRAGLIDFQYLANPNKFEDRDLQQVRDLTDDDKNAVTEEVATSDGFSDVPVIDPEIESALADVIAFVFRLNPDPSYLASVGREGTQRTLNHIRPGAEVRDFIVEIDDPETLESQIKRYIDKGIALSDREIGVALEHDFIDSQTISEHVEKHGRRTEDVGSETARNYREEIEEKYSTPDSDED